MFTDSRLRLAAALDCTGAGATAPSVVTDVIDLRSATDIGSAECLTVRFYCTETFVQVTSAVSLPVSVTADNTTDLLTAAAHGFLTGTPVQVGGTAPVGLSNGTTYFVTSVSTNTFGLATSRTNALANSKINFTDNGASVTVTKQPSEVGYFAFALCVADDSALTSNTTILAQTAPFGFAYHNGSALPEAGDKIVLEVPSLMGATGHRYMGVMLINYTLALAGYAAELNQSYFTAGKFDIDLFTDVADNRPFPDAVN